MSDGLIGLITTVVMAAVGGLTFVAYNHPRAYKKLYVVIAAVLAANVVGANIWNISNNWAQMAMSSSAQGHYEDYVRFREQAATTQVPTWVFFVIVLLMIYNSFLTTLPLWLVESKDK